MKKLLNILFVCFPLLIMGCSSTNTPRAVNKPKQLTDTIKPIEEVSPSVSIEEKETDTPIQVKKLFDFSNSPLDKNYSYTPYGANYTETEILNKYGPSYKEEEITIQEVETVNDEEVSTTPSKEKVDDEYLRIAVLLPLSGNVASVANDLKNAATMALFNLNSDKIILQFYDSQGTSSGAKEATLNANEDNADIIIGPLFAEEVNASKRVANSPIISFTTDQSVLSRNVFSIGFLIEQQIKRIVEYSISNGYKRFAIIVPDNQTGNFISDNFEKYTSAFGGEVVISRAYKNKKEDLMTSVKEISNFEEREKEYKQYMSDAQARLDYLNSLKLLPDNKDYLSAYDETQYSSTDDEIAFLEQTLETFAKKTTISDPEFDAIFVYGDDINDVIMIGSSLMYFDVHPDRIKFIGTSQLENPKIYSERAFRSAWYPSVSTKYSGSFNQAYKKFYNKTPNKIASLAYDAVSLVGTIAKNGTVEASDILNPNGWTGINGIFRFNRYGSSERNMDVKEIVGGSITKTKVISPAEINFLN